MVRRNEIPWLFMGLIMPDDTSRAADVLNIKIRDTVEGMIGIRILK